MSTLVAVGYEEVDVAAAPYPYPYPAVAEAPDDVKDEAAAD